MSAVSITNGGFFRPSLPKKGDVVRGKYQVTDYIGEGGMGVVMLAYHIKLRQHVALKVLAPDLLGDRKVVARFEREGRAAARMTGMHVARVYDVETTEHGLPFLVMERLQGEDLASKISRIGKLRVQEAVSHVFEACEGLAEAHFRGVIHRDLKPENLYLANAADGSTVLKLLDFGISKFLVDSLELEGAITLPGDYAASTPIIVDACLPLQYEADIEPRLTSPQTFIGTARYMAPEQVTSPATVDERTDIWALGVILFELLAGHVPFQGSSTLEVLRSLAADPVPDLSKHGVPSGLAVVIGRCLRKDYGERYVDVHELAQALAPFAGSGSAQRLARIAHFSRKFAKRERSQGRPSHLTFRRRPVAFGAALLGFAGVASWLIARGLPGPARLPLLQVGAFPSNAQAAPRPRATHEPTVHPLSQPAEPEAERLPLRQPTFPKAIGGAPKAHPQNRKGRATRNPLSVEIKR